MKATQNALHIVTPVRTGSHCVQYVLCDPYRRADGYHGALERSRVGPLKQLREMIEHTVDGRTPTWVQCLDILSMCRFIAQIDYSVSHFESRQHPAQCVPAPTRAPREQRT
uniref:Uncharacterized protein n=1 Tax=Paraburkholderia sprentiae WSM5005 TaxID=754502 RepID=A0A1I9YQT7_9BURK